jgi:hypothetical protein
VFGGNIVEADKRAPGAEWVHSAIDPGAIVRDFVKWDDQPTSLPAFRRVDGARLQDCDDAADGAGVLSLDAELQENPIREPRRCAFPSSPG